MCGVLDLGGHDSCNASADVGGTGAEEHLVRCLEDGIVCGGREVEVRDVATDSYRQLETPQGIDGLGATAALQLDGPVTDVINQLLSQLTR